jgi:hypothetical protein
MGYMPHLCDGCSRAASRRSALIVYVDDIRLSGDSWMRLQFCPLQVNVITPRSAVRSFTGRSMALDTALA